MALVLKFVVQMFYLSGLPSLGHYICVIYSRGVDKIKHVIGIFLRQKMVKVNIPKGFDKMKNYLLKTLKIGTEDH